MQEKNETKHIAINTVILFARMLILMIINLYSVKFILKGLGIVDYGIFTTVAGVVTTSGFIGGVLTLAIQRFYSTALGKNDITELKKVFSASINIVIVLSIVVFILFETIGLWFVEYKLNVPIERKDATTMLYHVSLVSFLCSFLQIPFASLLFSYEKIQTYAIISTLECIGKFCIAITTLYISIDHLVYYGTGLMLVAFFILFSYIINVYKNFKQVKYLRTKDKSLYKQILSFSGWSVFGSIANTSMMQGGIILINLYFGPVINAAFGIALQINNAMMALINSMIVPFRPAMQKCYAEGNYRYVNTLFNMVNKVMYYILLMVTVPLCIEMKWVLQLWLGHVTEDTVLFCQLILVYIVIIAMQNPITIIIHATGKIRNYHLTTESITLLSLPLTWLFYNLGLPSYYIFISMITVVFGAHLIRLYNIKKQFEFFSLREYTIGFATCAMFITLCVTMLLLQMRSIFTSHIIGVCSLSLASPLLIGTLVYIIGINSNERKVVKKTITSYYTKLCKKL